MKYLSGPANCAIWIAALLSLATAGPAWPQSTPPPLIERAKFFGNPSRVGARLSPDGRWLSWIAPRNGVLNVWVAPLDKPNEARALTDERVRPIRGSFWAPDSKTVLYINDQAGDENFLLYAVDVAGGPGVAAAPRSLTPFTKTRVRMIGSSPSVPERILVGINNRDARVHDVYSLELASGKLTLVLQNTGYGDYVADDKLELRLAQKSRADGGNEYFRIDGGKVESTPLVSVGLEDSQTTSPLGFSTDGKTLYWADARERDTAALLAQDVATGRMTVVAQDARADIGGALIDPKTGRPLGYSVNYMKSTYVALDDSVKADLEFLQRETGGNFSLTSYTQANDKWLVSIDRTTEPVSTWLYERAPRKLTRLFVSRPELEGAPLMPMQALELKTRDGLTMVSYLTLPKDSEAGADGKPKRAVPMVLFVHGGPWARDGYGFNSYHQWLANRGYAVLSVNFRGSTGFGKKYIAAGNLQWGRKMQDDLFDGVNWAVAQGITTRDKVAIMGGSYGGYATLAGLAFTPREFACGVDIVGPSNLFTLLSTVPPYWEEFKQQMYRRMGDPGTEAGRALLKERSPLTSADQIERPLLIGQGANDPRVNLAESEQIVSALKAKGIPVTYVVFPDEGHGFARPVNNIAFNAVTESFLARCLGGRVEPMGGTLKASSAEVRHGAEFTPGLKEATAK